MSMQFGLFMMPLHPPERSFTELYDRDLAQIVFADRLGYHEVWIGEHLTERWEYETVGGFGVLLAITQDSDNPEWDHRSLQLLIEEVGPRLADLGQS
jgi:hypothetical protein